MDFRIQILLPPVGKRNEKHSCEESDLKFLSTIMDLTQTPSGSTEPRTIDVNFPISDARNETSAAGAEQTKQTATIGVTQAQKTPLPAGTTGLSVPERTKPHVWN